MHAFQFTISTRMDSVNETIKAAQEEGGEAALTHNEKIISTLPKRSCWEITLHQYQGFWHLSDYIQGMISSQQNFKPQPSDIILCSLPKTGTTWLKALAFAIVTRSHSNNTTLLTTTPHDCVPFLEVVKHRNPQIPLVATHSSYTSLPPSVAASGCKLVYICRDPKDVLVSFWYFLKKLPGVNPEKYSSLQEGFDLFCEGLVPGGPYWEHVLEYWKASLECPERVLILEYEKMKEDIVSIVKKLAEFMGYPFNAEEERQGLVQKIIDLCRFENLSNLDVTKNGDQWPNCQFTVPKSSFYRKGEVGDWKNHLTQEMANRLDQITEEKLSGCGFTFMSHQSHD